jgi:hypothetical protein
MTLLSSIWNRIQRSLFPDLEEALGPITEKQQKLIAILELVRIEEFVPRQIADVPGRPPEDRRAMARSFIAKMIYNLPTTRMLIEQLRNDTNLRRICGWELRQDIPSESSFSRAFAEFSTGGCLPGKAHAALIAQHEAPRLIGHLSRDSSAIEAREKPMRKEKVVTPKTKKPRGRPRKGDVRPPKEPKRLDRQLSGMSLQDMLVELPRACDVGCKQNSKGFKESWIGYKLHVDWADGEIPITCVLTSASVHDSQVAIPLAVLSAQRVQSLYDLMDSAYDAPQIKAQSLSLGHVPIIDPNQRRGEKTEMAPATAVRYNERTTAERGFSLLKDSFGGTMVRVKGHAKVLTHLMFGILAIAAEQLLRLVR